MSGNGLFVVFASSSTNLVAGDTNAQTDVFLHNTVTRVTTRISLATGGVTQGNGTSWYPVISFDGQTVAYYSQASTLVAGDTNGVPDVFVHHVGTGVTERASVSTAGVQGYFSSHYTAMSADGRYIAFSSDATNFIAGDTNGRSDIYVRDLQTGMTALVSANNSGQISNHDSIDTIFSPDGRYIGYSSKGSNLVYGDTNYYFDVFVSKNPLFP